MSTRIDTTSPTPANQTDNTGTRTMTPSQEAVSNIFSGHKREALRVLKLSDCRAIERSRGDNEMWEMWCRWRRTRGKPTVTTLAVRETSFDESWTAFIRR
ncbi:hypothetical protein CCR75_007773 [Bremia lactucae]|uniref:Uncharacterized protein n=1 Tax=Bremia lactucae TaxID=4779 RepID=A0A976IJ23_BRELC|nr:hypothetical protein CCR75_007773 [Bremia lactucae]